MYYYYSACYAMQNRNLSVQPMYVMRKVTVHDLDLTHRTAHNDSETIDVRANFFLVVGC